MWYVPGMDLIGIGIVMMAAGLAGMLAYLSASTLRAMHEIQMAPIYAVLAMQRAMDAKHSSHPDSDSAKPDRSQERQETRES